MFQLLIIMSHLNIYEQIVVKTSVLMTLKLNGFDRLFSRRFG
jgi:hypothetical protein